MKQDDNFMWNGTDSQGAHHLNVCSSCDERGITGWNGYGIWWDNMGTRWSNMGNRNEGIPPQLARKGVCKRKKRWKKIEKKKKVQTLGIDSANLIKMSQKNKFGSFAPASFTACTHTHTSYHWSPLGRINASGIEWLGWQGRIARLCAIW